MSSTNPDPESNFTRHSEQESTCMFCFLTIRADRYTTLQDAEAIHADVCLVRPASPVRYAML
jgi:hypothetical protein